MLSKNMSLSPDGKWFWNGNEWIPAPPSSSLPQEIYSPYVDDYHTTYFDYDTNQQHLDQHIMIVPGKSSNKQFLIVIGIVCVLVLAVIGALFIFAETIEEPDRVTLSYIYVHTGDEVLATYVDEDGDVKQDFDYYEGDIVIQFDGEMYEGDSMIGYMSVSNFDEDACAMTVVYLVSINGGDPIELAKTGPEIAEQYDTITVEYVYVHGEI